MSHHKSLVWGSLAATVPGAAAIVIAAVLGRGEGVCRHLVGAGLLVAICAPFLQSWVLRAAGASEERYQELFENANDVIYAHDLFGNFMALNSAGERILGYSRHEILHMRVVEIAAPEHRESVRRMLEQCGAPGGGAWELEVIAKDGRRVALDIRTRVIHRYGRKVAVQGIARDVTERRAFEERLRNSQKMEAVGRLAGGVAHDFNNLLTVIGGYSDLVLLGLDEGDPRRQNVEEIKKAGERAAALTRQLLTFSRRQAVAPQVLDLNAVVGNMGKLLRRLIGEDIELVTVRQPKLGSVKADVGQVEQVVMNLAVNARDAMPGGGKLAIETSNLDVDETRARDQVGLKPGRYVVLAVTDTGCGMDAATQAHIFEPFFTTKGEGKGTGLGLATVYGIVKQSGGYISVASVPGQGSTFKIYLPRVEEAGVRLETCKPLGGPERGSETVLLVEDEGPVRSLVRGVLEKYGYRVLEASQGDEALQLAKRYRDTIHLMLTDVVMPQMNGRGLAERIKPLRPDLKVLFMSGYTEQVFRRHSIEDLKAPCLQKPFHPEALVRKVREVLDTPRKAALVPAGIPA